MTYHHFIGLHRWHQRCQSEPMTRRHRDRKRRAPPAASAQNTTNMHVSHTLSQVRGGRLHDVSNNTVSEVFHVLKQTKRKYRLDRRAWTPILFVVFICQFPGGLAVAPFLTPSSNFPPNLPTFFPPSFAALVIRSAVGLAAHPGHRVTF